jgi:hypothetical protein
MWLGLTARMARNTRRVARNLPIEGRPRALMPEDGLAAWEEMADVLWRRDAAFEKGFVRAAPLG